MKKKLTIILPIVIIIFGGASFAIANKMLRNNEIAKDYKFEASSSTTVKKPPPEHYSLTMNWKYANNSASSFCQPTIEAMITMDLTINKNQTVSGSGKIEYEKLTKGKSAACTVCEISGADGTITIEPTTSSLSNNTLTLIPILATTPHEQAQIDLSSCTAVNTNSEYAPNTTNHLIFSLEQSGFFDSWQITLSPTATKNFSFQSNDATASGRLQLTKD